MSSLLDSVMALFQFPLPYYSVFTLLHMFVILSVYRFIPAREVWKFERTDPFKGNRKIGKNRLFLVRESLVCDIPAGNFFYSI